LVATAEYAVCVIVSGAAGDRQVGRKFPFPRQSAAGEFGINGAFALLAHECSEKKKRMPGQGKKRHPCQQAVLGA
jgi:hypothetical protein